MNEPNFHYLVLDTHHPEYAAAIRTYEIEALKTWPANKFSIVPNVDGSRVLVKVDAGRDKPTWAATALVADKTSALVIQDYSWKDHDKVLTMLQTPEWKPKEEETKL